ncbi:MAG: hypothetical protein SFV22_07930, partial [Saprospiraceae bacterium]|nr:hypothetical protein [Saprospiraceae bacterium]
MMPKKCFLLVFSLFIGALAGAMNEPFAPSAPVSCTVPAPGNLHVEELGTTWVKLAWNNEPNAFGGYRIRIFRTSDNALIATQLRSQDQLNVTIGGLEVGVSHYAIINSRCENGSDGPGGEPEAFITLILELVVQGYTPPMPTSYLCSLSTAGQNCPLISGGALNHFMVYLEPGKSRRFSIQHFPGGNNNPTGHPFR